MSAPLLFTQGVRVLSERTMLERAVVAALGPMRKAEGGYCEFVGEYAGELGGVRDDDDIADLLQGRLPSVMVSTGDDRADNSVNRKLARIDLSIEVMVLSAHLRSHETRTVGDAISYINPKSDPGTYQMLADVRLLLMGRQLGMDGFGVLKFLSSGPALRRPGFMAYTAIYATDFRYEQRDLDEGLPLEVIEHRHHLEDSAAVNPVVTGETILDA